jgi:hypothetical protein
MIYPNWDFWTSGNPAWKQLFPGEAKNGKLIGKLCSKNSHKQSFAKTF